MDERFGQCDVGTDARIEMPGAFRVGKPPAKKKADPAPVLALNPLG